MAATLPLKILEKTAGATSRYQYHRPL